MNEENKILKIKIILEYVYIVLYIVLFPIILFYDAIWDSWDLGTVLMLEFLLIVIAIFVFIINPIRIIISIKSEIKDVSSKRNYVNMAILPVFLTILLCFFVRMYNKILYK